MTNVLIAAESVCEFGAYEELGVLVAGFRSDTAVSSLILQIDTPDSDLRSDAPGMYAEINDVGHYGAVRQFAFDVATGRLEIGFVAGKSGGIDSISVTLPLSQDAKVKELLVRMADLFASYPCVQPLGHRPIRKSDSA